VKEIKKNKGRNSKYDQRQEYCVNSTVHCPVHDPRLRLLEINVRIGLEFRRMRTVSNSRTRRLGAGPL